MNAVLDAPGTSDTPPPSGATPDLARRAQVAAAAGVPAAVAAAAPPAFRRSPREYLAPPDDDVEIQEPPAAPSAPAESLFEILLPVILGAIISLGTSFAFSYYVSRPGAGGGGAPMAGYVLLSFAPVLSAIFPTVYLYLRQRRLYRRAVAERQEEYGAYLADAEQQLQELSDRQRRANVIPNPPLDGGDGSRVRAERRDRRLWERSTKDADFLDLRLGEGSLPATFKIRVPHRRTHRRHADPLYQHAADLAERFREVPGLAVTLPLGRIGTAGMAGPRANLQDTVRALLMHLATHHSPTEVKVVLTFPEAEAAEWEWARWLPHTWSDDRSRRFVAAVPSSGPAEAARALLTERFDVLRQRALQRQTNRDDTLPALVPYYVFVFAESGLFGGAEATALGPLQELLLNDGPAVGAYSLFLADRREAVPQAAGAVVDVRAGGAGGRLHLIGPPAFDVAFKPDSADAATAEGFARVLARLRVQRLNRAGVPE
jgi:S-DNA-T family DNA segregation ATPase FtsK/SpoIIIE